MVKEEGWGARANFYYCCSLVLSECVLLDNQKEEKKEVRDKKDGRLGEK